MKMRVLEWQEIFLKKLCVVKQKRASNNTLVQVKEMTSTDTNTD